MSERAQAYFTLKDPAAVLTQPPEFADLLPIAVYACDADGRVCWFNRRAAELWGRSPRIGDATELFCGSFKLYSMDGKVVSREETPMAHVLRTGEPVQQREATIERPDGTRVIAMVHIDPIKDVTGKLLGAINCFHDTTELHRAKSQIAEGGAIVRQVLDSLPAAIYTTDAQGCITYFNRAAAELAGREPVLRRDKWCVTWKLFTPDGKPLPHGECPMAITLKENRPVRGVEAIAERPDGTRRPFTPFPTPLRDLAGNLVGAVNMLVDISERKDAERQHRVLHSELNHRVKNNMQLLHALLRAAQRETDNVEAQTVLAESAQRVGAMAAAQQVLYDANSAVNFDAKNFMEVLSCNLRQSVGGTAIITLDADEGALPNDAAMPLALILNELTANCSKYARPDGEPAQIAIAMKKSDSGWRLSVADEGPGFEPDVRKRRASGLGLVDGLAAQLGGTFAVTRERGAHCTIEFPAQSRYGQ